MLTETVKSVIRKDTALYKQASLIHRKWCLYKDYIKHHEEMQIALDKYRVGSIAVIGDSHVNFFSGNEHITWNPIGYGIDICPDKSGGIFTCLHLGACTAYSCIDPYSSSGTFLKTQFLAKHFLTVGGVVVCSFGEIDIRAHILKQAGFSGMSPEESVNKAISRYTDYLSWLKDRGFSIYVWGPIAQHWVNEDGNSAFPSYGSITERNRLTEYFTTELKKWCEENNITFMSIFNDMIDDDYNTIDSYIAEDNFHLSQRAMPLALREWKRVGLLN